MLASIVPLLIRMAFAHVVLIWGTNNTKTAGLSELDIQHREIGSRLVLAARVFYAAFIWMGKYTVCEFLRRLTGTVWTKFFRLTLRFIRYFLASTFLAVVIATLAECQPFDHYWQVVPDPGPKCRLGYANLLTMGVCDVITDLLLVVFPIPLALMSTLPVKRKLSLVSLFALSMILVAITCYRVPMVIQRNGLQSYRSLLASLEILAATAVSNAVVIGSFVRDKGVKKPKFKRAYGSSGSESLDHSSARRATITTRRWGSDADLVESLGIGLGPELQTTDTKVVRPAPVALSSHDFSARTGTVDPGWTFPSRLSTGTDDLASASDSMGARVDPHEYIPLNDWDRWESTSGNPRASHRNVSFSDVGGLLDPPSPTTPAIGTATTQPGSRYRPTFSPEPPLSPEMPRYPPYRRGSMALLQDVGGLLFPPRDSSGVTPSHDGGERRESTSQAGPSTSPYRHGRDVQAHVMEDHHVELQDAGGLLSQEPRRDLGR
ncbi:Integral membrane protein Pth11-like protein [Rasamsonia emersonii CBS 393.64]|uniref:Integral membrane protein Pth11-like protein n=1 Tax=Rasamsonia emersonii (strain ATCC 16479 / CBS 393.64 / IMI 116815) TaxID=1408163 RepID=A0A0F4Z1H2_RASE3|nr:Integral membrane protein Pth11-like protein [Rasamsonia emersonii CBS 393.64]KKA24195.1 Integral membrane protein Pth11-like protein [Rasamsonia emersonii CBS 393.64]